MFSKIIRKLSNFIIIPFTFVNWFQVVGYILSIYLSIYLSTNFRRKTGFVILKGGQKLKIRLLNTYDIGSIIETCKRKIYFPSFLKMPDNATIIDIGASIGDFSVFCALSFNNARVLSYEPTQDAFELLKENIRLNKLEDRIKVYPLAVSGQDGEVNIADVMYKSVSINEIFEGNGINRCDLLKMDIEGAEYGVLLNTPKEFLQFINTIVMECHIYDNGENLNRLRNHLTETGFDVITTKVTAHNVCYLYAMRL